MFMVSKYKYKDLVWIDLERPNRNEVIELSEDYNIPDIVSEELLTETLKSKVDYYSKHELIYLVLHFPIIDPKEKIPREREIDFIIGKDFVVTTHYQGIDPLSKFSQVFENDSVLERNNMGQNPGMLFFLMLKQMYKYLDDQLDGVAVNLEAIEREIYDNNKEYNAVNSISFTNRKIIQFRKAIGFHGDIIRSLEEVGSKMFGSSFSVNMGMIMSEYNKVNTTVSWYREMLNDLRDTNKTILNTKQNETMKILTIMTFTMLPITLITGVFGMNAEFQLIKTHEDLFFVIGSMLLTGVVIFVYFKSKKWL